MIIRVGVKFIQLMLPLKNDYGSLQPQSPTHVVPIMTEATELFGLFLLSKDQVGGHHPLFIFSDTAGISNKAFVLGVHLQIQVSQLNVPAVSIYHHIRSCGLGNIHRCVQ